MALKIGQTESGRAFTLPPDAVTQTFAALARRGAGKTNLGVVMAEEMLNAGSVIVVLDPVGVWHGLRSSYDGKSSGYPILILGGEHGDLPLDPHAGKTVADFLVGDRVSTILDVSGRVDRAGVDDGTHGFRSIWIGCRHSPAGEVARGVSEFTDEARGSLAAARGQAATRAGRRE